MVHIANINPIESNWGSGDYRVVEGKEQECRGVLHGLRRNIRGIVCFGRCILWFVACTGLLWKTGESM